MRTFSLCSIVLHTSEIHSSAGRLYKAMMTPSSVLMGGTNVPGLALAPFPLFLEENPAERGLGALVVVAETASSGAGGQ